jgi:hypothetical protein
VTKGIRSIAFRVSEAIPTVRRPSATASPELNPFNDASGGYFAWSLGMPVLNW